MEPNIWACIYRSLNRKKNIEYENEDMKSNYSDYFISDQEKSLERLSVTKFHQRKYKEKEETNTMERLIEAEKESSSSDESDEGDNIKKLLAKEDQVHRSSERSYKSHFQLSPKESNRKAMEEDKQSEKGRKLVIIHVEDMDQHKHKSKAKRRARPKRTGDVDQQKKSKFFDEELLVIYYATNLIM